MDKYSEISILNEGSYGVVQLVRQLKTSRLYAAKRVSLALSSRSEIENEIRVHEKVSKHLRVVQLVDHFLDVKRNEYVLIVEYCSSGDLHDAIARGERPSNEGIRRIMLQLLDTLEHCHAAHIYHRDIKPENIFLQHNGNIKLGDWGLATDTQYCSDFGTGSEQYMAPECFDRSATTYDAAKADIWAAGIVLVNTLFGRNPFKQATERDPLFKDFASSRETLYDIFPTLTSDVFRVLRHCLTLNPEHRSIPQMRAALQEVKNWTTDDELEQLQHRMHAKKHEKSEEELRAKVVLERTAAKMVPVVHKPFRVPSAVAQSLKSPSTPWDRRKMYTPPTSKGYMWSRPGSYARSFLPRHLEEPEEEEEEEDLLQSSSPSSPSSSASSAELTVPKPHSFGDSGMFSMDDEDHHQSPQHDINDANDISPNGEVDKDENENEIGNELEIEGDITYIQTPGRTAALTDKLEPQDFLGSSPAPPPALPHYRNRELPSMYK